MIGTLTKILKYLLLSLVFCSPPAQSQVLESADLFSNKDQFRLHILDELLDVFVMHSYYPDIESKYFGKNWCFSLDWIANGKKASFCNGLIEREIDPKNNILQAFGASYYFTKTGQLSRVFFKSKFFNVHYAGDKISYLMDSKLNRYNFFYKNKKLIKINRDKLSLTFIYEKGQLVSVTGPKGTSRYTYKNTSPNLLASFTTADPKTVAIEWSKNRPLKLIDEKQCLYEPALRENTSIKVKVTCPKQKVQTFTLDRGDFSTPLPIFHRPLKRSKNSRENMSKAQNRFLKRIESSLQK